MCLLMVSLCAPLVGCGKEQKQIIILTNGDDSFWDAVQRGVAAAASDLRLSDAGMLAVVDKGDYSAETQINKLQAYAGRRDVAAIAISSVDAEHAGIAAAMKALRERGTEVITIDSDMRDPATRFAYLGTNNLEGGATLGKVLRNMLPEGGSNATFDGLKTVANALDR